MRAPTSRLGSPQELQLYLLQLVQALKFEGYGDRSSVDGALATFLIHRATENPILGNYLLWYLIVETEDPKWSEMYGRVNARLMEEIVAVRCAQPASAAPEPPSPRW